MLLKDSVPPFLLEFKELNTVYDSNQIQADKLDTVVEDVYNQCFIETSTWGLEFWEKFLGITFNEPQTLECRRDVIKSKIRGSGTTTVNLIKDVASAFSNGEVEITENIAPYIFEVKFTGTKGVPQNLEELKESINAIKPAHLAVTYKFTFLTWDEFDRYNLSWDEWDNLNLSWDEFEKYKQKS